MVKNAGDLGSEDLLEKGMATHSSILAWRIPWMSDLTGALLASAQLLPFHSKKDKGLLGEG